MITVECGFCGRVAEKPGELRKEDEGKISHGQCARCTYCDPAEKDLLEPEDYIHDINKELDDNIVWKVREGEKDKFPFSQEELNAYERLVSEVKVHRAEGREGGVSKK